MTRKTGSPPISSRSASKRNRFATSVLVRLVAMGEFPVVSGSGDTLQHGHILPRRLQEQRAIAAADEKADAHFVPALEAVDVAADHPERHVVLRAGSGGLRHRLQEEGMVELTVDAERDREILRADADDIETRHR